MTRDAEIAAEIESALTTVTGLSVRLEELAAQAARQDASGHARLYTTIHEELEAGSLNLARAAALMNPESIEAEEIIG